MHLRFETILNGIINDEGLILDDKKKINFFQSIAVSDMRI